MARIVVLTPYEPPADGIGKHSAHLVEAWDSAGHSVLVIAPGNETGLAAAKAIGSNSRIARILRRMPRRQLWNEVIEFAPDVVVVQFAISAFGVQCWSLRNLCAKYSRARIPVAVAFHEPAREYNMLGPATRLVYRAIARSTNVPIVFSSAGRDALVRSRVFEHVTEIPHGTTGLELITDDDVKRVRAIYHVEKPLILALGFTSSDKGTDVLVAAANAIAAERDNDVQFLIAGSPRTRRGAFRIFGRRDARYQARLERQAKTASGVDIAFTGYVADKDVAALLFTADVVSLPYRRITQSGIANMALASRSVIVSSDLPGLRSDLGDAAAYVEVGNSQALADRIAGLLGDGNASERWRMRELSGKRAVANNYSRVAEMILAACQTTVQRGRE
jgi:glycosyltransferase involved in cell wall biosynthesis